MANLDKTILIVDDSVSLRLLVNMTLTRTGYQVIEAADGQAALTKLELTDCVDLIVSDLNMPVMDGLTFLHHVRRHARHKATPVIILTTAGRFDMKEAGRQAGATAWLVKPFDGSRLLNAVSKLLPPGTPQVEDGVR